MEGEGVEHPDRGSLGRRRQGPRMRPGLILAASGAGGTLGGTTPLLWQSPPRTSEVNWALVCTAVGSTRLAARGASPPWTASHPLS